MTVSRNRHEIKIGYPIINTENKSLKRPSLVARSARLLLSLRHSSVHALPSQEERVRVVCISDTHNSKPDLPPGDILIHSGDLSQYGTFEEVQAQLGWLKRQPHPHKIVIAGNHDLLLDVVFVERHPDRELTMPARSARDLDWGNIEYLQDRIVEIVIGSRTLKIFGSPYVPRCGNFAFQYDPASDVWDGRVPEGTDVVVTHGPPALHQDGDKGCRYLLKELWRVRPSLVVFGHIHHARGQETIMLSQSQQLLESIAVGTSSWVDLPRCLWFVLKDCIQRPSGLHEMSLVNAACYRGRDSIVVSL